jgi:hypothetical protein
MSVFQYFALTGFRDSDFVRCWRDLAQLGRENLGMHINFGGTGFVQHVDRLDAGGRGFDEWNYQWPQNARHALFCKASSPSSGELYHVMDNGLLTPAMTVTT